MAALPLLLLVLAVPLTLSPTDARKLPDFIPKCSVKDPKLSQCIVENGRKVLSRLAKGVPTLRLPVLDPLKITEVRVQTGHGPSSFDMTCRDITITGLANTQLDDIEVKDNNYTVTCTIPRLEIICNYEVHGRILVLPLTGSGKANLTFDNAVMRYKQDYTFEKKEGHDYAKFFSSSAHFDCSQAYFKLDNLFDGDQQLGDNANMVLNENWRAVVDDLGQPFSDAAAVVIRQFSVALFTNVPYDEIFDDVDVS